MPDDKVLEDIETECKKIDKLFEDYEPLLIKVKEQTPDFIEKEYLGFRHFSRHSYACDLEWDLMKDLVLRSDDVRESALGEVRSFMSKIRI